MVILFTQWMGDRDEPGDPQHYVQRPQMTEHTEDTGQPDGSWVYRCGCETEGVTHSITAPIGKRRYQKMVRFVTLSQRLGPGRVYMFLLG